MNRRAARLFMIGLALGIGLLAWAQGPPGEAEGYVVPPEQLLDFMAESGIGFETLSLTWERCEGPGEPEEAGGLTEQVWFRGPGTSWVQGGDGKDEGGAVEWPVDFLALFSGKRAGIERFLVRSGVDVQRSVYARVDRSAAYRIGREGAGAPALFLEKSRFIPLLLAREMPDARPGELLEIRFQDYRKTGNGWFPHEILYKAASGVTGIFRVKAVRPNAPIPERGPSRAVAGEGEENGNTEESRKERVIRAFEKTYGE